MFWFLFLGHKILNVYFGFSVSIRNRNSTSYNFLKGYIYMAGSGMSSSSIVVILSIASELKPDALK